MFTSVQETLIENEIKENGYYHLQLSNVKDEDIRILKNNRDIKDIYTLYNNGYAKLDKCLNEDKPYVRLFSMDKGLFEYLQFNLTEGRFPNNENEVVISRAIISNGKVNLKIGDKMSLDVGERQSLEGYDLKSSNPYNKDIEKLVNTKHREFTIVGIIERPNYNFEEYVCPGYTIITTNINSGNKNAYITLKNARDCKTVIPNILGASDYNSVINDNLLNENLNYEEYTVNDELLKWEAFAFGNQTVLMLLTVSGIVIAIIMFTSVFCIRNSILIATTEKMKMYGMLASVGTTKKQIRSNVIFESLVLGLIGIPIGIICGIVAIFIVIKIINLIGGEYMLRNVNGISFKISLLPIVISTILSIFTIYLSALSSAKKASRISPIELLRNAEEVSIDSKTLKTPKIISKLFGTGGELAYKNLKRSAKKYRTTVISLVISIFVFITMNSVVENMFGFTDDYYEDYEYNFKLASTEAIQTDVNKIKKLQNAEECFFLYENKDSLDITDMSMVNTVPGFEKHQDAKLDLLALDNESFMKYAKKIGLDGKKLKNQGILSDDYIYYENDKGIEIRRYKYKNGDMIEGKVNGKDTNIKIGAVTDVRPYGLEKSNYLDGYLVVNLDYYKDMDFIISYTSIQSNNTEALREEIKKLDIQYLYFTDYEDIVKEEKAMSLIIKIFLYGFITVITLIGVTNIFNTITSNMELRQKEFAMLKSIGMTKKEFNRMINLETIFYSTKSLIYGIVLGLIGTFTVYKAFSIKIEKGMYIPINPIIISIIAVFILVYIIMKYSMAKINKQNTIETIRNENI